MTDQESFRLSLLCPPFQARIRDICARMMAKGFLEPFIGSTQRSPEEQAEALRRGTTSRKQHLTWHFRFRDGARAVDIRKRLPNGKEDPTTHDEAFFLALYQEAKAAGCRSLAYVDDHAGHPVKLYINGGKVWDAGHIEWREPYGSLVEAIRTEIPEMLGDAPPSPPDHDDDVEGSRQRALGLASLPPSPFV